MPATQQESPLILRTALVDEHYFPILQRRKSKFRKIQKVAEGHKVRKWQGQVQIQLWRSSVAWVSSTNDHGLVAKACLFALKRFSMQAAYKRPQEASTKGTCLYRRQMPSSCFTGGVTCDLPSDVQWGWARLEMTPWAQLSPSLRCSGPTEAFGKSQFPVLQVSFQGGGP